MSVSRYYYLFIPIPFRPISFTPIFNMRVFYRYLSLTLLCFFLLMWILPHWRNINYPRMLGPTFKPSIRKTYQIAIENQEPQVLLLGNSVIEFGIDVIQFEQLTRLKTLKFSPMGSATAYWYLIIKNNTTTVSNPPKYLLIFFLDNLLTTPDLGVNGPYLPMIDELAGENETVLLQKAYLNQLDPMAGYLDSTLSIFGERQSIISRLNNKIKYTLPQLFQNCDKDCLDKALDTVFSRNSMLPDVVQKNPYNLGKLSGSEWDFHTQVEKSFLPDMIQIARERGINLILVREKNSRAMTIQDETPDIRKYFQEMADFLKKEGVPLLDFGHDPALTMDLFQDEMHFNSQGRTVFTQLVAESFLSLLNKNKYD